VRCRIVGTNLRENPNYAKLAEDMGAKGYRITHASEVGDALRDAIASGQPCVIDGVIEGGEPVLAEPFRRDALKPAYRMLDKYKHLNVK
jgi:sulfoacetaldehyde acetyltransferase